MRQRKADIEDAGGQVVLVGMGTPEEAEDFRERFDVPFPVICDADRKLYRAFDLKRMGVLGFFSPSLALKGMSAMSQGHLMGLPTGDVKQLSGVFVIDTGGGFSFTHISRQPDDTPDVEEILAALTA